MGKLDGKVAFITGAARGQAVKEVEARDRRIVAVTADERDEDSLRAAFDAGGAALGPVDISNAIVWLVSDDARYVTGVTLPVDAGFTNKK